VESIKFYTTPESQLEGAMWQPMTGPCGTSPTNQTLPLIEHQMVHVSATYLATCLPVSLLTSSCATCHPYSGDTCHPRTGPVAYRMPHHLPRVFSRSSHVICMVVRPVQSACHVALYGLYGLYSHPFFLPVWVFE
jgi:hypothetical protein